MDNKVWLERPYVKEVFAIVENGAILKNLCGDLTWLNWLWSLICILQNSTKC